MGWRLCVWVEKNKNWEAFFVGRSWRKKHEKIKIFIETEAFHRLFRFISLSFSVEKPQEMNVYIIMKWFKDEKEVLKGNFSKYDSLFLLSEIRRLEETKGYYLHKNTKKVRNFHFFHDEKYQITFFKKYLMEMLTYSIKRIRNKNTFAVLPNHYRKTNRIEKGKNNNNLLICKENHVLRRRFPPS